MGVVPVTAISTRTEQTKPVTMGQALCDDSDISVQESLVKTTDVAAELLISPGIDKVLLLNQQQLFTGVPDSRHVVVDVFC